MVCVVERDIWKMISWSRDGCLSRYVNRLAEKRHAGTTFPRHRMPGEAISTVESHDLYLSIWIVDMILGNCETYLCS